MAATVLVRERANVLVSKGLGAVGSRVGAKFSARADGECEHTDLVYGLCDCCQDDRGCGGGGVGTLACTEGRANGEG